MRINLENKSMDMEEREWNFVMSAYIRTYLFESRNEDPERIIFPMFTTVPHPIKPGVTIPVEYVVVDSPVATEIAKDGSNIPEVTPEQEAALDEKEDEIKKLKAQVVEMETEAGEEAAAVAEAEAAGELNTPQTVRPPMGAAFGETKATVPPPAPDRKPNLPPVVIPPGQPLDNMSSRDKGDQARVAKDLRPEPEIDESKERPTEIVKPKEE